MPGKLRCRVRCVPRRSSSSLLAVGILVVLSVPAVAQDHSSSRRVSVAETGSQVTLSNDYLELVFDRARHKILRLAADHSGTHRFAKNLLASDGINFDDGDTADEGVTHIEFAERTPANVTLRLTWTSKRSQFEGPIELILSLGAVDRDVHVRAVFPASHGSAAARGVRVALRQWFLLGLFDRGAVQYIAGQRQFFAAHDPLRLFYTVDRENGSIAIEPSDESDLAETVLLSGDGPSASGIELRPHVSRLPADTWTASSDAAAPASDAAPRRTIDFNIYANDLPFPAHRAENMIEGDAAARRDSAAYFTAVYGSAAGVLGSYTEPGSAYPTLAFPDRPYGDAFDFFDPDAWSTVTALSYSGDPLLQKEARRILERSEAALRPDGQMPHHFEGGKPTYVSIAKSSQTGPNIFWVIAASEYAAGTGNEAWLRNHYGHLRLATDWVLAKYDPAHKLLRADGPLFIDVFRRSGYALDTNVAALYLLERMTEVAEFCGDPESAERYRSLRRDLLQGIQNELWDGKDHFITQKNLDGSLRDLVDYDSNFAALAFGVLDSANAAKLLHRLDAGPHTHPGGRGTWVSERRYEKDDCYGGNDGDSDTAMARIWWLDMAARVRMADRSTFDALLETLESDLLREVWMPERYDDTGQPAHNNYYHEYPDVITMVLRELRFGVHVGMREVTIDPFGRANFTLRLGDLRVTYSSAALSVMVPGASDRSLTIRGLRAHTHYEVSDGRRVVTDAEGTLRCRIRAGKLIQIRPARH